MAEEKLPPLSVPIELDDSGLQVQLGKLGRQAESTRLGMWGLGEAAQKTAEQFGVSGQIARQLGNSVEGLAARLGAGAAAFGGIALAGMVAGGVYTMIKDRQEKLAEEERKAVEAKKRLTEEMERQGKASLDFLSTQDKLIEKSRALRDAEYELYKVEYFKNNETLNETILGSQKRLNDLYKERENLALRIYSLTKSGVAGAAEADVRKSGGIGSQIAELEAQVRMYQARLKDARLLSQGELESLNANKAGKSDPEEYKDTQADIDKILQESVNKRYMIGLEGDEREEMQLRLAQQKELDQLEEFGASKEEIAMVSATHAMEWRQLETDFKRKKGEEDLRNQQKIDQMELQNRAAVLGQSAALMDSAYQLSHGKYKAFFYISRAAAAAEAIIQGHLGASKAVGTFWGMEMAPVLIGMGYANAAVIAAQTFEGGASGGGAAAVPTYTASPVTGLPAAPAASPAAPPAIYISINGSPYEKQQLTQDVLRTIYDNNGSVGGLSVSVERSA